METLTSPEFRILGQVAVVHDGAAVDLGGPRHRRLLAVLLVHAGETVSTGRLIDALWGATPPRSAPAMLHVRVSELRTALRTVDTGLVARHGGYQVDPRPDSMDARRFERLAAAGAAALARGELSRAGTDLRAALALWRGPALAEFAHAPFARAEAARLGELRLQATENRMNADLGLGRHTELVAELDALVVDNPLRERLRGQLMLALYRAGRQAEALHTYQVGRELIADQLGLDPGVDLRRLHAALLRQDPVLDPPARRGARRRDNLPVALTPLVGRRDEVRELRSLLRHHRLVTVTGVGGVGKSRLALEVAAACRPDLRDGAWLVELDALTRPGEALAAVAATVGVRRGGDRPVADALAAQVGSAATLLVLDTCDELIDEVATAVAGLLRRCPGLRVLVTSRERLGVTGETVRPLSGLGLPEPGDVGAEPVGRSDAVRFLVDRLAAVRPGVELTDATAGLFARICRGLDGIPLALELAAAAIQARGLEHIAARLDERFRLLTHGSRSAPARHQSLRAMVEWSVRRLDPVQRQLFGRLAGLPDGFTLDDVEAAWTDPADRPAVSVLTQLVDRSLVCVVHTGTGQPRYRLLETLRAYAVEHPSAASPAARVRRRVYRPEGRPHTVRSRSTVTTAGAVPIPEGR